MIINIKNNSGYKNALLTCNGRTYNISDNRSLQIESCDNTPVTMSVDIGDKNCVLPNFLDFLSGFFSPRDSSVCVIRCSYVFEVMPLSERCDVVIDNFTSGNQGDNIVYDSVFADSENASVRPLSYRMNDIKSVKKKHTLLQLFVMSTLPLAVFLIIMCIIKFSWFLSSVTAFDILFFVLPGLRKIKRFNDNCTDENAQKALMNAEYRRRNGGLPAEENTKIGKFLSKIFGGLFN